MLEDWAREQFNQGNGWCELSKEGHSEKWEQAIALYEGALQVRTREKAPELYAATMQNLGTAYRELRSGDRGRNVRKAIHCYHEALHIRGAASHWLKVAALHHNLGNAFLTLAAVEKENEVRHADRALRHFDHALQLYSQRNQDYDCAAVQLGCGQAYMLLARQGSEGNLQGFRRVRYCAPARATENQIYVAMAGTVGNLPEVPCMATHYGQASILTPSDYFFARDGIAAEGTVNQEQMVISDVDLDLLEEQRVNGTVLPLNDLIKDAYDRAIHCADRREAAAPASAAASTDTPGSPLTQESVSRRS